MATVAAADEPVNFTLTTQEGTYTQAENEESNRDKMPKTK